MDQQILTLQRQSSNDGFTPDTGTAPVGGMAGGLLILGAIGVACLWASRRSAGRGSSPASRQALHWVAQGKALERSQQYEAAIAAYDAGLQEHPQDYRLWHERGLALAKLQRFEAAIESYDRAYEICPQQSNLAHERGDALLELGRYEEAIASFDICLRYGEDGHILTDRAYALMQLGRHGAALPVLQRVLQQAQSGRSIDPETLSRAHYYQIEVLCELQQWQSAWQSALTAVSRYPDPYFKRQFEQIQQQLARA
ncbi:tetratricopeptide repeat protein [Alkalinema sp. FACHB-956]|uniref:tetratricopeptide repeat protein n=1 Tax=Alkalinema sp. FACHB-956 TaxID=2692768 RepID=UPI001683B8B6|nr:tetratricopeptide repeat protein [Alkalinema sp. FACHB-956]MBD2325797.1 tetratricopeptide repeat protein [Alkalinema sp. FACHB-956]